MDGYKYKEHTVFQDNNYRMTMKLRKYFVKRRVNISDAIWEIIHKVRKSLFEKKQFRVVGAENINFEFRLEMSRGYSKWQFCPILD